MSNEYGAFLDSFHHINIIVPVYEKINDDLYLLTKNELPLLLKIESRYSENDKTYIHVSSEMTINPSIDYEVKINDVVKYHLHIGKITLTEEFDNQYYYDDWLGFRYINDKIVFHVWSPVAKELKLVINYQDEYLMTYLDKGVYVVTLDNKNNILDKASYYYSVRVNDIWEKALDPYGIAITPSKDACYLVDINQTRPMDTGFIKNIQSKEDAIIYEMHIRDFTINLPVAHPGTFMGLVESKEIDGHGIDYLKDLGITYVQLMPVFAFGGVDYRIKSDFDPHFKYNWGYNPILYNAVSGWYVTNPSDPYKQINEFKTLVDTLHASNIGVNLDVVYNHVYEADHYGFGILVPKYPFRYQENGQLSDGSWCGNDIAYERKMNHKFLIDSVSYWQNTFHIDGLRFDLMGLIDIPSMNDVKDTLTANNSLAMIYGEGWQMNTCYRQENLATMFNNSLVPDLSFFNDYFRNNVKGKDEISNTGIFNNQRLTIILLESLFSGGLKGNRMFSNSQQSINYVECHDNYTFYDQQIRYGKTYEQAKNNAKFALGAILLAKGIPFIHSGQEMLRSKFGYDNSYNLPDLVNHMPWHLLIANQDVINYTKKLISLRKELKLSNYTLSSIQVTNMVIKISYKSKENNLIVLFNIGYMLQEIHLEEAYQLLFKNDDLCQEIVNNLTIGNGLYVLQKKKAE